MLQQDAYNEWRNEEIECDLSTGKHIWIICSFDGTMYRTRKSMYCDWNDWDYELGYLDVNDIQNENGDSLSLTSEELKEVNVIAENYAERLVENYDYQDFSIGDLDS